VVSIYAITAIQQYSSNTFLWPDVAASQALMRKIVEPQLETILDTLKTSSAALLNPQQEGHPITYNHYFIENLQK
jgi:cAMP phosphodiesterase